MQGRPDDPLGHTRRLLVLWPLWNRRRSRICNQFGEFANELFVGLDLTDTATYYDSVGVATGNQQEGEVLVAGLTHQRGDLSLGNPYGPFLRFSHWLRQSVTTLLWSRVLRFIIHNRNSVA